MMGDTGWKGNNDQENREKSLLLVLVTQGCSVCENSVGCTFTMHVHHWVYMFYFSFKIEVLFQF